MPNNLTIAFLAGALAFAGFPAIALDLPDYGSKNFSPSGDTPTYFANETAPVSARTADTTARDWSAVDAEAPVPSAVASTNTPHTAAGRHGRFASAPKSGRHAFGKARGSSHATGSAKANITKAAWTVSHHASAAGAKTSVRSGPVSAAKTTSVKHGRANPRHARAAVTYPAVSLSDAKAVPTEA